MPSHCTPAQCVLFFFFFSPRAFQEEEFIGLSSAIQGLNVVIYKKPTGAQKKAREAILALSEGFVALQGCGNVLWHSGSCMVLLRALRGHFRHHTLPSKTKTYLSLRLHLKRFLADSMPAEVLRWLLWQFCCTVKLSFISFFFAAAGREAVAFHAFTRGEVCFYCFS